MPLRRLTIRQKLTGIAMLSSFTALVSASIAFLAYDLVLIPPYLALFPTVEPEHLTSLRIYMVVLFYSTALAVYYLFINKATRGWGIHAD